MPADKEGEKAPSVSLILTLAAGGPDQPGRLWAGTIPGALFRSDDRGETWRLLERLWNQPSRSEWRCGGHDDPGIPSLCSDPPDSRKTVLRLHCRPSRPHAADDTSGAPRDAGTP